MSQHPHIHEHHCVLAHPAARSPYRNELIDVCTTSNQRRHDTIFAFATRNLQRRPRILRNHECNRNAVRTHETPVTHDTEL